MPHAPDLSGIALDDRYELRAPIGEGAFGRVYEGRDRRLERSVAVKVIKPWWAEDPEWVATFERETHILARVSDPGIVQIYDVGHAPEGLYYVSELVDGEDLARHLRRGPVPPWQACAIALQLCRALAHAHAQRIVHRDVKPANILLSREGRVKVGDFGVAQLAEGSTDGAAATIVGTPRYMAPEQGRGLGSTPATDIYSVGVVLYEMLAGRPPFTGNSPVELALRHLQDPPPPLSPRLPTVLVGITERALSKRPADRYPDGAAMAGALADARSQSAARPRSAAVSRPRHEVPAAREVHATWATAPGATAVLEPPRVSESSRVEEASDPVRSDRERSAPVRAPARFPDRTQRAQRDRWEGSPRRNVDPPGRRRAAAAVGVIVALVAGMVAAAALIGGHTPVPRLTGLTRAAATARARSRHLHAVFATRYDAKTRRGTVITQRPQAGTRVARGTRVRLTVSRGPAPVEVPVVDASDTAARADFTKLGLHTTVTPVPAPGVVPGTVVRTSPAAGHHVAAGSTVALFAAEAPQWRPLTTITGTEPTTFRIRGTRWRIVYQMAYHGTCTWIFFCSGPHAQVTALGSARPIDSFGLDDGQTQTQTFNVSAGVYQVKVTPGGDEARWSLQVQDDY